MHLLRVVVFAALLPGAYAIDSGAQSFPARALRYIMPLPAGSETDVFARTLGRQLSEIWGQPVVVENRPGGGTSIGSDVAAKAAADGYVLLHAVTAHAINPTLYPSLPYDTLKDFACITQIGALYGVLVAHPSLPVKTIPDLIALAKKHPGQLVYASGGTGTAGHIVGEALRAAAGIDMVHAPYKGSSLAVLDLLPGRVPLLATVLVEAMPYIQSGKVRPIATTSPTRAPSLPQVPTVAESLPALRVGTIFWTLLARAGTPAAIISKLNTDVLKGLQAADVRKRLAMSDVEYVGSRPEQCDVFLREQVALWGSLVKATNARIE